MTTRDGETVKAGRFQELLADSTTGGVDSIRASAAAIGRVAGSEHLPIETMLREIEIQSETPIGSMPADVVGEIVQSYQAVSEPHASAGVEHLTNEVLRRIALAQINSSSEGNLHFDSMLTSIMGSIAEAVNCDGCSLFLYDRFQQTLMLRATVGLNEDAVRRVVIRADAGITGLAATTGETQVAVDAQQHPAFLPYPSLGENRYTSQTSVPIRLENPDRLVGVLNLQTRERHEFTDEQISFIEHAASDLAVAIESARLFRRTDAALTRQINEMSMLQTATRGLASTLQPEEIVSLIARHANELVSGTQTTVFRRRKTPGIEPSFELTAAYPAGTVDAEETAAFAELAASIGHTRSARATNPTVPEGTLDYGVPLMTSHAVHGTIVVRMANRTTPSDEHLSLLQAFADSAALALENAELYDETRRGYATASTLLQEMHHRVRNNLQLVASLLSMQANRNRKHPSSQPLLQAVMRVQSIASIHDLLSGNDVTSTTVSAVVQTITDEASTNLVAPAQSIRFEVIPGGVVVTSRQATILALIVNECITNAIVHGMSGRDTGSIIISAAEENGLVEVVVEDDGVGPNGNQGTETNGGLGTRIARTLAESDLGGSFTLEPRSPQGSRATIRFPYHR